VLGLDTTAQCPYTPGSGIPATTRASFYIYNTPEEIEMLAEALKKALKDFRIS
jgi:selenocysteine lyase/cysteine desulfurase